MISDNDDWLKTLVDEAEPYWVDANFTERVLMALPPARGAGFRLGVLGITGVVAGLVGFVILPGGQALLAAINQLTGAAMLRTNLSVVSLILVTLMVAASAAAVLSDHEI